MAVRNRSRPGGSAQVIESIYDATLDAPMWPAALEAIRAYIWADSALLRVYGARFAEVVQATTVGFDPAYAEAYRDEFVREDPIVPVIDTLSAGRVILLEDALPFSRLRNTRFYCEYMKPQDKRHVLGGPLLRRDGFEVMIGAQRGHDSPAFGTRELARVRRVVPHLVRALTLADRLEQTSLRARLADTMLGTAVPGILLFDAHGRVVYLNPAAESLLVGQKALALRGSRLQTPHRQLQQWLDLVTVSKNRDTHAHDWEGSSARFTAFDGSGDLALAVLPWRNASMLPACPATGVVTVGVLTHLDGRETYSVELIQSLFGLTAGEARLAEALVTTGSLAAAAQKLAIRPSTARDRIKSVFRKTGFTTQMALITALLRSPTRKAILDSPDGLLPTEQT